MIEIFGKKDKAGKSKVGEQVEQILQQAEEVVQQVEQKVAPKDEPKAKLYAQTPVQPRSKPITGTLVEGKKLNITDTILRDAHQSQAATRMRIEDMLPACEILDSIGYWSLECWGGATFDTCIRFLNEDPWERLRKLRAAMPNTRLQMLFRGQNILGYRNYSDDVVDRFCKKSIENGIDVVRIFDALNDVRNLQQAMKSVKEYGAICEPAMAYTLSPVHNEQYWIDLAVKLEDMGADVIGIKDMANLLLPFETFNLVTKLKERVKIPIHLHTHNTCGTGDMVYIMAAQAGVDIVDCALSPLGNGTSQPATESLVATLDGKERDTGLSLEKMSEAAKHFRVVADRLKADGALDPRVLNVDTNSLVYQVPGGMLSNLISQLKEAKAEDKYYDVMAEIPRVREEAGYPPLVTPTSQIVGTQAVMNILAGERYKMVGKEFRSMIRGEYGKLPANVNKDVMKKCIGDDEVITCRPADNLQPEFDNLADEIGELALCEEDVLTYALFPQVGKTFLEKKLKGGLGGDDELAAVIAAAISAYSANAVLPLIRSMGSVFEVSSGLQAPNPLVRNSG